MIDEFPSLRIQKDLSRMNLQVYIVSRDYDKACEEIIMTPKPRHSMTIPCMELGKTEAQVLIDDLWNCGLRPTEGSGSAGSLLATQNHLKDMQKIVDATLNHIIK